MSAIQLFELDKLKQPLKNRVFKKILQEQQYLTFYGFSCEFLAELPSPAAVVLEILASE